MQRLEDKLLLNKEMILNQATAKFQKWKKHPENANLLEIRCARFKEAQYESFGMKT